MPTYRTEKGELPPTLKNKFLPHYTVYDPKDSSKVKVMQRHMLAR